MSDAQMKEKFGFRDRLRELQQSKAEIIVDFGGSPGVAGLGSDRQTVIGAITLDADDYIEMEAYYTERKRDKKKILIPIHAIKAVWIE